MYSTIHIYCIKCTKYYLCSSDILMQSLRFYTLFKKIHIICMYIERIQEFSVIYEIFNIKMGKRKEEKIYKKERIKHECDEKLYNF